MSDELPRRSSCDHLASLRSTSSPYMAPHEVLKAPFRPPAASSRSAASSTATITGPERRTAERRFSRRHRRQRVAIPASLADRLRLSGEEPCARAPPAAGPPAASSAPISGLTAAFAPSGCAWSPCPTSPARFSAWMSWPVLLAARAALRSISAHRSRPAASSPRWRRCGRHAGARRARARRRSAASARRARRSAANASKPASARPRTTASSGE